MLKIFHIEAYEFEFSAEDDCEVEPVNCENVFNIGPKIEPITANKLKAMIPIISAKLNMNINPKNPPFIRPSEYLLQEIKLAIKPPNNIIGKII